MVRVKICGIRTVEAALAAVEAGVDALGFVFTASPRQVTPREAGRIIAQLPPFISTVGVFVDASRQEVREVAGACHLDVLQFHGEEPPEYCRGWPQQVVKGFRVRDDSVMAQISRYEAAACLLDAYVPGRPGGTGQSFDWDLARQAGERYRLILAGGITPENVEQAVRQARPYAIDVSSGVETDGAKDPQKIRALLMTVRRLNYELDKSGDA